MWGFCLKCYRNQNKGCTFVETNKEKDMTLSKSVEERAIEAVKQAISKEQELISEMIAQRTERSKQAMNQIRKNVYGLIHINS
jgi:aspartyl-tRNA synthetase